MIKTHNLPDWYTSVPPIPAANVVEVISVAYEREDEYYFDGFIEKMLVAKKIPMTIEIALDAEDWSCVSRLNYGDESDASAIYSPFEIESFAFLWNQNPKSIHGIAGNRLTLSLKSSATRYPFINFAGITSELYLQNDVFVAQPHLDFTDEWENAA